MPLEAGTRVGRYTILRLIAQGGMAEVYRAEQEITAGVKRPAAVKLIRPEYSESEDFRQMFLDEARTACTLSHPNIVHIYEVGESDDGLLFMAMELVPGETLATINRTLRSHDERFSDEALFTIGINTASALEAAHQLKVEEGRVNLVHRDVSPHNLLLSASGNLKLIDFGIAKAATNRNLTMPGVTKGKAGYFSPEQAMGKRLDGRSDLFSLGITLYKLACGATPFDEHPNHAERHAALVRGQWQPLRDRFPGLPDGLYDVVDRALQLKPEDRYATARELREDLERAAFEAGIRVSQSSLIGYVDDDGEVTATGGTRSSAFPAVVPPPSGQTGVGQTGQALRSPSNPSMSPAQSRPSISGSRPAATGAQATAQSKATLSQPRQAALSSQSRPTIAPTGVGPTGMAAPVREAHTERVEARRRGPRRAIFLGVAFGAAVIIGVFGIMLMFGQREPIVLDAPRPVVVDPSRVAKPPTRPVEPVKPVDPTTPPEVIVERVIVIDAGSEDVPLPHHPKTRVVARPKDPDAAGTGTQPTNPVATNPVPAKPPDEAIPPGEGKLRIGATNSAVVTGVVVGRDDWGAPPVNRAVSSGTYTVLLKLSDGRKSPTWRGAVFPDRTTTLVYDVENERWSAK